MVGSKGKVERFAAAHPVFTREMFRSDLFPEQPLSSADSLLRYHTASGRFKHVAPGVYAVVPAHLRHMSFQPDRYLVASMIRADGVIAFHSALDLHGLAYSDASEILVLSHSRPGAVKTEIGTVRFVMYPAALRRQHSERDGVTTLDRRGLDVAITGLERTLVDCLEYPDYAGGIEELAHALNAVEAIDSEFLVEMTLRRRSRVLAGMVGWWLETRSQDFLVDPRLLDRLRAEMPSSMRPVLGTSAENGYAVPSWRILLPELIANPRFEDVPQGPAF
ncbi:transcriptional regulator [Microvirga sp. ACRRW]|uniref:type IV toxin-antitoxin system AbiEi family antitoxin domain-containing protein n=1 Tax=Microvirga sp. ACRRW TaxID=2918205 RepID=UPI001EF43FD0|nr:transcriptional regulator [Microvirga sp. ACRRW]MCG7392906.1 transcriptional regulator [Microvirga sp. ACRRW]